MARERAASTEVQEAALPGAVRRDRRRQDAANRGALPSPAVTANPPSLPQAASEATCRPLP